MDPKVVPKKSPKNRPPLEAPLGRLLAPSADILVPRVSKKGAKRRPKEGSQTELNPGPQKKQEKVSLTQYLLCFGHVGHLKKLTVEDLFGEVKTEVHKMMPSKPALGGSDDHLEPPRLIFGSPLGSPFGDKIEENEALQHMSEPLGSQGGSKSSQGSKLT